MVEKVKVFKVETFGAVDGPGVRLVIFVLGCKFRCKYCHNPESWDENFQPSNEMSVQDILNLYDRNKEFYENGGITISGGEPMLHHEFIKQLAIECKKRNIHLAIDTSACNFLENKKAYEQLIDLIDLWIIDVKALNKEEHQFITGFDKLSGFEFVKFLEINKKPYWIRQVIIKSINDDEKHLDLFASFVKSLKYCKKTELLSYHNLAIQKYQKLGIDYQFKEKKTLTTSEFNAIKDYFNKKI